ncbi:hypothetical protein REPUB_Repub02eG0023300 [Reevesia pubescens]
MVFIQLNQATELNWNSSHSLLLEPLLERPLLPRDLELEAILVHGRRCGVLISPTK